MSGITSRLVSLKAYSFKLPMKASFAHASHVHSSACGVLVEADFGVVCGWGEAAPRLYVTGETVTSVLEEIRHLDLSRLTEDLVFDEFELALQRIASIEDYFGDQPVGRNARCAVEIALLDAFLKYHQMSFLDLFEHLYPMTGLIREPSLRYTLVADLNDLDQLVARLTTSDAQMPERIKLKVTSDLAKAEQVLQPLRALAPQCQLALDVNEGWSVEQFFEAGHRLKGFNLASIEEPLQARSWRNLASFRRQFDTSIMLDESICTLADLLEAASQDAFDTLNVRLAKCGGFFESLRMIDAAKLLNKSVYFGVHIGEAGPLWATQRALAACFSDRCGVEVGKQDLWFPKATTAPAYRVDRDNHTARVMSGFGHGVSPSPFLKSHLQGKVLLGPTGSNHFIAKQHGLETVNGS